MNELLEKLYEKYWYELTNEANKVSANSAHPLLIKVKPEYEGANIKVMIVGQETDGWGGSFNDNQKSIKNLMNDYYNYFYQIPPYGLKRKKRPFWNNKNFTYFRSHLTSYFKPKNSIAFIWNNISKIGNNGRGRPHNDLKTMERKYFPVIREEIDILKPNIIIFTSGERDNYIKYHFGNESKFIPKLCFENSPPLDDTCNLIAEIRLHAFPKICAVRVQHPNRRALENTVILNVIKQCWESMEANQAYQNP